jgi:hypothetical protein
VAAANALHARLRTPVSMPQYRHRARSVSGHTKIDLVWKVAYASCDEWRPSSVAIRLYQRRLATRPPAAAEDLTRLGLDLLALGLNLLYAPRQLCRIVTGSDAAPQFVSLGCTGLQDASLHETE